MRNTMTATIARTETIHMITPMPMLEQLHTAAYYRQTATTATAQEQITS